MDLYGKDYEGVPNDLKKFDGNYRAQKQLDKLENKLKIVLYNAIRENFKFELVGDKLEVAIIIAWLLLRKYEFSIEDYSSDINKILRDIYKVSASQNRYFKKPVNKQERPVIIREIIEQYQIESYSHVYPNETHYPENKKELGIEGDFIDDRYAETGFAVENIVDELIDKVIKEIETKPELTKQEIIETINKESVKTIEPKLDVVARTEVGRTYSGARAIEARSRGINDYIWRTQLDEKVRPSHSALEGTLQSFLKPPPAGTSGELCNPGEAINCRCYYEFA